MAKQIYDYWFVQYNFPNNKNKPYKSSGGEMIWSEELKRNTKKLECCAVKDLAVLNKKYEDNEKHFDMIALEAMPSSSMY